MTFKEMLTSYGIQALITTVANPCGNWTHSPSHCQHPSHFKRSWWSYSNRTAK